jgi:RteC protein.
MKMKLTEFSDNLYAEVEGLINVEEEPNLEESKNKASALLNTVNKLKGFVTNYTFKSKEEEIIFFKDIKPRFQSMLIFYKKTFQILSDVPVGLHEDINSYYHEHLQKTRNYLDNNKDFLMYYKSGSTLFDTIYFVRKEPDLWLSINEEECEWDYYTSIYDHKLSKILAYEQVAKFLINKIKNPGDRNNGDLCNSSITWTAPKAALIELLYALQTSGSCNNGSLDVKDLAIHFENLFNVKLGNFYRTFQEIRIRKMSRTSFLDHLKDNLVKRMDQADEFPKN